MTLVAGSDFRLPEYRREVFLKFYQFQLDTLGSPGGVYLFLPFLRDKLGLSPDESMEFALLNGQTQNPMSSYLIWTGQIDPLKADFDTDRRYWRKAFWAVTERHGWDYWLEAAAQGWDEVWRRATAIPTFGRLSAWSFIEYLAIMGIPIDAPTLMLHDINGSRSHRNGLCLVLGLDQYDWHRSNPGFDGKYPSWLIQELEREGKFLLRDAEQAGAVPSNLTLESALCTYKGWHRPNRRYPNVYHDMAYERIKKYEDRGYDMSLFWAARGQLPEYLRLEAAPYDPGLCRAKQNWYRETGEVIMMEHEYPELQNRFAAVAAEAGPYR